MSKLLPFGLGALLFMGVAASSYGQVNTGMGAHLPAHGWVNDINEREAAIQKLIADGVQAGHLSSEQAEGFKHRLNQIQSDKTTDMMQDHGHLKKEDMQDLKRKEEALKRDIEKGLKKP